MTVIFFKFYPAFHKIFPEKTREHLMYINPNESPFGITSCVRFFVHLAGSIPVIGAVVGIERLREVILASRKEANKTGEVASPVYAKEHCMRALLEISGLGMIAFVTELVCKVLGLLLRVLGHFLAVCICGAAAVAFIAGFFVAYLLYGVTKIVADAIPLCDSPATKKRVNTMEVYKAFANLSFDISKLIRKTSQDIVNLIEPEENKELVHKESEKVSLSGYSEKGTFV